MKAPQAFGVFLTLFLLEPSSIESRQNRESQEPAPRFGVEVDYVEVNALVTDEDGNFVSNLAREDFGIYEDGELQEISGFTVIDIPVEDFEPVPFVEEVEPDVRSNRQLSEGRIFVIVLDDQHTDARRAERVKRAAAELVEQRMGTNDIAAVLHTSGRPSASQEFTSRKSLLLAAIDRFVGRKLRSATLEKRDKSQAQLRGPQSYHDPWASERVQRDRNTLEMLREIAESLVDLHGRRKAIILYGEGLDGSLIDDTQRTIGAATRANVAIYPIDPRGMALVGEAPASLDPVSIGRESEHSSTMGSLQGELAVSQGSMRVLAAETGGFTVLNQNDFAPGLARIVEENSRYYLLGYYPTNNDRDGKFRNLEVRVGRPDLVVRARKGYLAPGREDQRALAEVEVPEGSSPELNRLVQSPIPIPGIEMRATASVFRDVENRSVVPLVVEMNIEGFRFEERDGELHDKIEFSAIAVDYQGDVKAGVRRDFQVSVLPRGYRLLAQSGFRVMTALELSPGKYQLRIVASEAGAGQGGSLFYDVEIPEYGKSDLIMTPLLVTSAFENRTPVYATEEDKQKAILIPTARRAFSRQDKLLVLAGIYPAAPSGSEPATLEVVTTIKATDEQALFTKTGEGVVESGEGITHRVEIPLAALPPGDYVLEMKSRDRANGTDVSRKVVIEIF